MRPYYYGVSSHDDNEVPFAQPYASYPSSSSQQQETQSPSDAGQNEVTPAVVLPKVSDSHLPEQSVARQDISSSFGSNPMNAVAFTTTEVGQKRNLSSVFLCEESKKRKKSETAGAAPKRSHSLELEQPATQDFATAGSPVSPGGEIGTSQGNAIDNTGDMLASDDNDDIWEEIVFSQLPKPRG